LRAALWVVAHVEGDPAAQADGGNGLARAGDAALQDGAGWLGLGKRERREAQAEHGAPVQAAWGGVFHFVTQQAQVGVGYCRAPCGAANTAPTMSSPDPIGFHQRGDT
jgi:hypothetical protein